MCFLILYSNFGLRGSIVELNCKGKTGCLTMLMSISVYFILVCK